MNYNLDAIAASLDPDEHVTHNSGGARTMRTFARLQANAELHPLVVTLFRDKGVPIDMTPLLAQKLMTRADFQRD